MTTPELCDNKSFEKKKDLIAVDPVVPITTWVIVDLKDFVPSTKSDSAVPKTFPTIVITPRFYDEKGSGVMEIIKKISVEKCKHFCHIKDEDLEIDASDLFSSVKNLLSDNGVTVSADVEWHFNVKCLSANLAYYIKKFASCEGLSPEKSDFEFRTIEQSLDDDYD